MNRTERRSLTYGMHSVPNADPVAVRQFVKQDMPPTDTIACDTPTATGSREPRPQATVSERESTGQPGSKKVGLVPVALIPVTVRLRPAIAVGLKRASLERQLAGEDIYTQQELVEQVLEPWLKAQGYLT